MRIESAAASYSSAMQQRTQVQAGDGAVVSFSAVMDEAKGSWVKQADFANMTKRDLFDWMNAKLRNGEMTFDESTPFLGMCCNLQVNGTNLPPEADTTRYDFTQRARSGIEFAQSNGDEKMVKMLQDAIRTMERDQGRTISADIRA